MVIHNAAFDIGFLDAELARLDGYGKVLDRCTVEDTLLMARKRYPGQRNSLDALCKRLGVDNSQRQLHGALLDAQILLDVYLTLTSGQGEIGFQGSETATPSAAVAVDLQVTDAASRPRVHIQQMCIRDRPRLNKVSPQNSTPSPTYATWLRVWPGTARTRNCHGPMASFWPSQTR